MKRLKTNKEEWKMKQQELKSLYDRMNQEMKHLSDEDKRRMKHYLVLAFERGEYSVIRKINGER